MGHRYNSISKIGSEVQATLNTVLNYLDFDLGEEHIFMSDRGLVPEMRICSILWIYADL